MYVNNVYKAFRTIIILVVGTNPCTGSVEISSLMVLPTAINFAVMCFTNDRCIKCISWCTDSLPQRTIDENSSRQMFFMPGMIKGEEERSRQTVSGSFRR